MEQEKLLKISFITSLFSIFFLLIFSFYTPQKIKISDITEEYVGKKVKIEGKIIKENLPSTSNFKILTIQSTNNSTIEITLNSKNTFKNKQVEVQGIVQKYENKLQIQAEKIIEQ